MKHRWILVAAAALAAGCAREIGDDCSVNSDCGTDRICDTSQPGGYCTSAPCRPGDCPSEAVCIEFSPQVTYCMRACDKLNPCRLDYVCVEGFKDFRGFCDQTAPETSAP